ncbi:hypothetical protein V5279_30395 [Bradyrhizobium sp. 26S5]|uniref:hypothetical protein n=1 Tax=Bradyrhizobium sp. 26S5 TaxID=3139729 RepID=UPI0030CF1EE3
MEVFLDRNASHRSDSKTRLLTAVKSDSFVQLALGQLVLPKEGWRSYHRFAHGIFERTRYVVFAPAFAVSTAARTFR